MNCISGLVITHNAAKNLAPCLTALSRVCEEIVIVDSFSTDRTSEICSVFPKVRFLQNEWPGFGPQKNYGASHCINDHILSIDSDEVLSEQLIDEITEIKKKQLPDVIWLNRLNNYYGRFFHHGMEAPDHKPRIYNKHVANWNDSPVHEKLVIPKGTSKVLLSGHLYHYTIDNISDHLSKINTYSSLYAVRLHNRNKQFKISRIILSPLTVFFKAYIFKGGFKDGVAGLILAMIHSSARFQRYAKLWELHNTTPPQTTS